MKNLKTHIIKFTAIAISVMYILMPIHKEVKSTLHSISHFLEMPNAMLSHNHNDNLNYKAEASAIAHHEHKILDFLDNLLDVNDSAKNSNKPNIVDSKIDKHFHSSKYEAQKLVATKSLSVADNYKEKVKDLFYRKIIIPPQKSDMQQF